MLRASKAETAAAPSTLCLKDHSSEKGLSSDSSVNLLREPVSYKGQDVLEAASQIWIGEDGIVNIPKGLRVKQALANGDEIVLIQSDDSCLVPEEDFPDLKAVFVGDIKILKDSLHAIVLHQEFKLSKISGAVSDRSGVDSSQPSKKDAIVADLPEMGTLLDANQGTSGLPEQTFLVSAPQESWDLVELILSLQQAQQSMPPFAALPIEENGARSSDVFSDVPDLGKEEAIFRGMVHLLDMSIREETFPVGNKGEEGSGIFSSLSYDRGKVSPGETISSFTVGDSDVPMNFELTEVILSPDVPFIKEPLGIAFSEETRDFLWADDIMTLMSEDLILFGSDSVSDEMRSQAEVTLYPCLNGQSSGCINDADSIFGEVMMPVSSDLDISLSLEADKSSDHDADSIFGEVMMPVSSDLDISLSLEADKSSDHSGEHPEARSSDDVVHFTWDQEVILPVADSVSDEMRSQAEVTLYPCLNGQSSGCINDADSIFGEVMMPVSPDLDISLSLEADKSSGHSGEHPEAGSSDDVVHFTWDEEIILPVADFIFLETGMVPCGMESWIETVSLPYYAESYSKGGESTDSRVGELNSQDPDMHYSQKRVSQSDHPAENTQSGFLDDAGVFLQSDDATSVSENLVLPEMDAVLCKTDSSPAGGSFFFHQPDLHVEDSENADISFETREEEEVSLQSLTISSSHSLSQDSIHEVAFYPPLYG